MYGNIFNIETSENEKFRNYILKNFLSIDSARKTDKGYVFDYPLEKCFEMELVLGLPTSG